MNSHFVCSCYFFRQMVSNKYKWFRINIDKMYKCCPGRFRILSSVSITPSIAYTQLSASKPWLLALAFCTPLLLALAKWQLKARLCRLRYRTPNSALDNPSTKLVVVTVGSRHNVQMLKAPRLLNITTIYLFLTSFFFRSGLESRDKLGLTIYSYTRWNYRKTELA